MGAAYSSLSRTKVLYATSLVLLGAKTKFLRRKPSVLVSLEEISEIALMARICWPQSDIIRDTFIKVFCWLNVFQSLVVEGIVKEYMFVMLMPSHSHRVTLGHIERLSIVLS